MGTSTSHGGPKDRKPLLPDWALPAPAPAPLPPPVPPANDDPAVPDIGTVPVPGHPCAPPLNPSTAPTYAPLTGPPNWSRAGKSLGHVAKSGGSRGMGRAAQRYVRARGGSRRAA